MSRKFKLSLFIFRRDLRLDDNTGLIGALESSDEALPCFILDPRLVKAGEQRNHNAVRFLTESILDLSKQLETIGKHLYCFSGVPEVVVAELIETTHLESVFLNRDYTPFSNKRDSKIRKCCEQRDVSFHSFSDYLIHEPQQVLNQHGKPYTNFSHFYKKAKILPIRTPIANVHRNYFSDKHSFPYSTGLQDVRVCDNGTNFVGGGSTLAQSILNNLDKLADYGRNRDYPIREGTSNLSAHLKFGTCSVRMVHSKVSGKFGETHPLLRQLFWRDFFTHIGFHFPRVFKESFRKDRKYLPWNQDYSSFEEWCKGQTGFPIVDAGMRELNSTGHMHNRVRMIVASFLVKDLHIDWKWGEKYFAKLLLDYDVSVNNGNWQWVASTGCDSQPYFRIFNPWLQQQKYDPECRYIKKWIPELAHLTPSQIHQLYKSRPLDLLGYPKPILDHSEEAKIARVLFSGRILN